MDKFIMTVVVILLVYLCVYAIVNRICKCIEHHTEYKYPSWSEFPHTNSNDECCRRRITEVCGVKETQCTHCNHLQICSFKAQFLAAQKAVDEVTVSTGDRSFISLRDISWIRPVSLECSYFSGKMPVMRDVAQSATLAAERASALRFMDDPT